MDALDGVLRIHTDESGVWNTDREFGWTRISFPRQSRFPCIWRQNWTRDDVDGRIREKKRIDKYTLSAKGKSTTNQGESGKGRRSKSELKRVEFRECSNWIGETRGKAAMRQHGRQAGRETRNRRMGLTKCDIHFSRGVTRFAVETRGRITRAELYIQSI